MHGSTSVDVPDLLGTIHPFLRTNQFSFHTLRTEISNLFHEKKARKLLGCLLINMFFTIMLLIWCNSTNSMALTAYTYLTIFDLLSILTCLVSLWVRNQQQSPVYSFGYERFEVLFVFASTLLAQFGSVFILKESVERMVEQPDIHTGRLLVGTAFAFIFHISITYSVDNPAFNHVVAASSSSWLQEHVSDMSESLCHVVPGLSKLLLPRINPFALIAIAGGLVLILTHVLIDFYIYYAADTWAAVWIALMTCGTMFPMSIYSGKILLQTTPSHIIGQLDKCLREASTLDGVLEFRHEHFWTVAFGKMAGSVHVRVRRDADEQMVLAHVYHRLSNLISVLTVQIFKDEWLRPSAFQILGDTTLVAKTDKPILPPSMFNTSAKPNAAPTPYSSYLAYGSPPPMYRFGSPLAPSIFDSHSTRPEVGRSLIGQSMVTQPLDADFIPTAGAPFPPAAYSIGSIGERQSQGTSAFSSVQSRYGYVDNRLVIPAESTDFSKHK